MTGNIRDTLNLLNNYTPGKFFNQIKIISSYLVSKYSGRTIHWGMPLSISIEPTTSCNLRCPECPSGLRSFSRPTGMLDVQFYKSVINDLYKKLIYLIFYFQGEPYLHPHFFDLVKYASSRKIYTATSTNAHYLNDSNARKTIESGLSRLIISIDGTEQETYENYRIGGSLDKVIEGTKNIIKWKKELNSTTPYVIFQFLVVKQNEHQVEEIKKLGKKLGVDKVALKTAQVYDYKNGNDLIPETNKYSRYSKGEDGNYKIKNKLLNHCWKLWHSCVITWDGLVVPCCFDKDAKYRLGNLKNQSFSKIWTGKEYFEFRKKVLNSRKQIDICQNCTEGTSIWAEE
ncbi:MAG: SPASM domain-containing protein [Bacteroidetes bacterium]|nr:SPASM domain-containing protein [Bacteroidota bacterium]HET6245455.1 SPASM domain-containing protein [Bacteroidia bacterium]